MKFMTKRQEQRDQAEERIFEAAKRIFSCHGYDGSSVRMISKEAGVSPGLLYNYFQSKEELLMHVFQAGLRDVEASFSDLPDDGAILTYLENNFRIAREHESLWRLIYIVRTQESAMNLLGVKIERVQRQVVQRLESRLAPSYGSRARAEAIFLNAALEGIIYHFLFDKTFDFEAATSSFLSKYS